MPSTNAAEVRALAGLLDELDYYELLELPREATTSQVRQAYYALSRRFHPDAGRTLDGACRESASHVSKRVAEAYAVLRDPRRRKAYDAQIGSGEEPGRIPLVEASDRGRRASVEESLGRTPNGKRFFALARADIDRGALDSAYRNLQMAITFEPGNEFFRTKLAEVKEAQRPPR